MATVVPGIVSTPVDGSGLKIVVWEGCAAGDTLVPFIVAPYPDKTVQFVKSGAFGGNVGLEGSVDPQGSQYDTLNDPQGNALSGITSGRIENVLEHCYLLRPTVGAGVSDVDVYLLLSNVKG